MTTATARCFCATCFYCDTGLPRRHEHDHFPVPKALAGTRTVPACMNCHELKDRTPLDEWPLTFHADGLHEVLTTAGAWPGATGIPAVDEVLAALGDHEQHWSGWSCAARLVYGKLAQMAAALEVAARVQRAAELHSAGVKDAQVLAASVGLDPRIVRSRVAPKTSTPGRRRAMTANTIANARERLERGESATAVAHALGVSRATLYRNVVPWPMARPRPAGGRPSVMTDEKRAEARGKLASGESAGRVARSLGVSRTTVLRHTDLVGKAS